MADILSKNCELATALDVISRWKVLLKLYGYLILTINTI